MADFSKLLFVTLFFSSSLFAVNPRFEENIIRYPLDAGFNSILPGYVGNKNGRGVAWIDCDNDTWQDLFVTGGGSLFFTDQLYINNEGSLALSNNSGVELSFSTASNAVAVGDYNNDGFDDIFIAVGGNPSQSHNVLLKNIGDCQFVDVSSSSGLSLETGNTHVAAFGDVDGDNDLDIIIGHWGTGSGRLYRNQLSETGEAVFIRDDGAFIDPVGSWNFAGSMSDYNNDNLLDFVMINDFGESFPEKVFHVNNGNGTFSGDINSPIPEIFGMGLAVGDYDNNGWLDYYATTIATSGQSASKYDNVLYMNNNGSLVDVASTAGVKGNELFSAGVCSVYWGTEFLDVDNDGYLDLYVANDNKGFGGGGVDCTSKPTTGSAAENHLFMNNANPPLNTFTDKSVISKANINPGVGLAIADYDKDGRIDVVVQGQYNGVTLLRNTTPHVNAWLEISLNGVVSNKRGIGAKVRVESTSTSGSIQQMREIHSGSSHGSTNSFSVHFGFPAGSTIDNVTVEWPSGEIQKLTNIVLNQSIVVTEVIASTPKIIEVYPVDMEVNGGEFLGILGEQFCVNPCVPSDVVVKVGNTRIFPTGLFDTYIVFAVAPNINVQGPLSVTTSNGRRAVTKQDLAIHARPTIDAFFPTLGGGIGTEGSISGSNFCSSNCNKVRLKLGNVDVPVVAASNSTIFFRIPQGATTGKFTVYNEWGGVSLSSADSFFVGSLIPRIIEVYPVDMEVNGGKFLGIRGEQFCVNPCVPSDVVVKVGNTRIFPTGLFDTYIVFAVAPNINVQGPLSVTTSNGRRAVTKQDLTIHARPTINAFFPARGGGIGTEGSISGSNFCSSNCNKVRLKLGNVDVPVVAASNSTIFFRIPQGATTGKFTVYNEWGGSGISQLVFVIN